MYVKYNWPRRITMGIVGFMIIGLCFFVGIRMDMSGKHASNFVACIIWMGAIIGPLLASGSVDDYIRDYQKFKRRG